MSEALAPEFFERMVESVGVGIAIYGDDGQFVYVNDAYADLFDVEPSSLVGMSLWAVNPAFDRERFEAYWASFDDAETRTAEATHEVAGRSVPVSTVTTRRTIDGVPYHFGTITDITERKRREEALRAQNERLDSFAAVVSHDLRNPLNVAQGYLDCLEDDVDDRDEIELIDGALDRMEALIDDLLTLARGGETIDDPEPVVIDDVATAAWVAVDDRGATLERNAAGRELVADANRLQQLFENLFRNSVEHSSTGPRNESVDSVEHGSTGLRGDAGAEDVTITVGSLPGGFYVADDGPGIPADEREHVFEAGVSSTDDGTGFGLSIVAEIADAHGWTVDVTESAAGGARFEFRVEDAPAERT